MHAPSIRNPARAPAKLLSASRGDHCLGGLAGPAMAQDRFDPVRETRQRVVCCCSDGIFLQAGFALSRPGSPAPRAWEHHDENLIDFCAGAVAFFAVGFAIAMAVRSTVPQVLRGRRLIHGDGAFTYQPHLLFSCSRSR